jgi:hypothetical protein
LYNPKHGTTCRHFLVNDYGMQICLDLMVIYLEVF